jgi:hypothetical protein
LASVPFELAPLDVAIKIIDVAMTEDSPSARKIFPLLFINFPLPIAPLAIPRKPQCQNRSLGERWRNANDTEVDIQGS